MTQSITPKITVTESGAPIQINLTPTVTQSVTPQIGVAESGVAEVLFLRP